MKREQQLFFLKKKIGVKLTKWPFKKKFRFNGYLLIKCKNNKNPVNNQIIFIDFFELSYTEYKLYACNKI